MVDLWDVKEERRYIFLSVGFLNKCGGCCHAPGGDGVSVDAGPVRVLCDHSREDLLLMMIVAGGDQV